MKTNDILYLVFGIELSIPKSLIERHIRKMDKEEFIRYAKGFMDNPYHPCSHYSDRSQFNSVEEWEKFEIEGGVHKLIRREKGVKLYWEGNRLKCLVEYSHTCCG